MIDPPSLSKLQAKEEEEAEAEAEAEEEKEAVARHQTGNSRTEINILPAMPTAQTAPKLAIPALPDHASEPKPAMAVAPHSNNARPTDRYAIAKSPP